MQCLHPLPLTRNAQNVTVRCGQCHCCRIQKREEWAARILLESTSHSMSLFVTLTYSPEHLPLLNSLCHRDATLFLKRLRKRIHPTKVRYFLVGEYGSRTQRPHYHSVLFGLNEGHLDAIDASWGLGFTTCAVLTPERARYVARYTTKKLTGPMSFTDGRCPEYARQSRRPGLGRLAALKIGQQLTRQNGPGSAMPAVLKIGGKSYPLDRYTQEVIQTELGYPEVRDEIKAFKAHQRAPEIHAAAQAKYAACPTRGEALREKDLEHQKRHDVL